MTDEKSVSEEKVIKEYPNSTRWLEGQQVIGVGNLILTSERLVFLHRVSLDEGELERLHKISETATNKKMIDLALAIHKRNFQVPLTSIVSARTGFYSLFPFPRLCLRIAYTSEKKKRLKNLAFMFTISIWRGWFQLELTVIRHWVKVIKRAAERKQSAWDAASLRETVESPPPRLDKGSKIRSIIGLIKSKLRVGTGNE